MKLQGRSKFGQGRGGSGACGSGLPPAEGGATAPGKGGNGTGVARQLHRWRWHDWRGNRAAARLGQAVVAHGPRARGKRRVALAWVVPKDGEARGGSGWLGDGRVGGGGRAMTAVLLGSGEEEERWGKD